MEENNQASEPGPVEPAPMASPGPKPAGARLPAWAGLLLLANLGASTFLGWQWQQQRQLLNAQREEVARRLETGDTVAKEARGLARQGQEDVSALQSKLSLLEEKVGQSEGQAAALAALYQEFSRSRDDRVLAEVEQTLNIASQQLKLASNVSAALVALQGADARLAELDRPQFLVLRQAIAHDIENLRALPQLDISGLALRLEALMATADSLPLAFAGAPTDAREAPGLVPAAAAGTAAQVLGFVRTLGRELWQEVRSLVRVERLDGPAPTLLGPEQSAFLRESLKIRLLTARLALLARDGRTYAVDLAQARQWLERYYDLSAPAVKGAVDEIAKLQQVNFATAAPEIADSLTALASLQTRPGLKGAPPPAPAGAASAPAAH